MQNERELSYKRASKKYLKKAFPLIGEKRELEKNDSPEATKRLQDIEIELRTLWAVVREAEHNRPLYILDSYIDDESAPLLEDAELTDDEINEQKEKCIEAMHSDRYDDWTSRQIVGELQKQKVEWSMHGKSYDIVSARLNDELRSSNSRISIRKSTNGGKLLYRLGSQPILPDRSIPNSPQLTLLESQEALMESNNHAVQVPSPAPVPFPVPTQTVQEGSESLNSKIEKLLSEIRNSNRITDGRLAIQNSFLEQISKSLDDNLKANIQILDELKKHSSGVSQQSAQDQVPTSEPVHASDDGSPQTFKDLSRLLMAVAGNQDLLQKKINMVLAKVKDSEKK